MIAVELPKELEAELNRVVRKTHKSKSYYIRKALARFLEDREDYVTAITRLEENNARIPYEKMRKMLELDD